MRMTKLFTKTRKHAPSDEEAKNAQLLIRAGYIHKEMAGVYAMLPLGIRVLENIKQIVREEMNAIGGQELIMTSLQRKELWQKTDRWDDKKVDVWFKSQLKNGTEVGLGWSHEEAITDMMKNYVSSYRDLPVYAYQFQTKLRNELRAKSGLMRGREFVMKDLYSYSTSEAEHQAFYQKAIDAYHRIFKRVGLGNRTYITFASGGAFAEFSHEFQAISDVGEDTIYLDRGKKIAINKEVYNDKVIAELGLKKANLEELKAVEVGNIFSFGTTKTEELGLYFADQDGKEAPVTLGSYGIGVTRLMGLLAEHFADDKGLVWPEEVAPYKVYLARLGEDDGVVHAADLLYTALCNAGVEVLYDDRGLRAGESLGDADLLGMPWRIIVSAKTVAAGKAELAQRSGKIAPQLLSEAEIIKALTAKK